MGDLGVLVGAGDEVVGAEAGAAVILEESVGGEVDPGAGDAFGFFEALEDGGGGGELAEGLVDGLGPVFGGEVAAEVDAAGSPGLG